MALDDYLRFESRHPEVAEAMKRAIAEAVKKKSETTSRVEGRKILRRGSSSAWNSHFGDDARRAFGHAMKKLLVDELGEWKCIDDSDDRGDFKRYFRLGT